VRKNPGYFKGRYWYVKEWRAQSESSKRKEKIQEKISAKEPLFKVVLLKPSGIKMGMIQDKIVFERVNRNTFAAYGQG
jgi:hypothetical protein